MAYVVTARKWRPQKFVEVVGQEHITTTLKNAIKDGRIAHAYLFAGPRGVGKTTTARILSKALNCLNPIDYEPCNECETCKSIQAGQLMDIIEIDGASNRGIDEVRTLRESVKYAPTRGKYKVYIIDEVHMLTKESFNAFLKTLEEPPAQTIFIFATTDVHKVPLTIISRCQRFDFRRIELDTIKSLLEKIAKSEEIEIDDKTLTLIARKADGALRDAESYFDQVVAFCGKKVDSSTVTKILNLIDDEVYFKLSDAVLAKNFKSVFEISEEIYNNGWNFTDFMDGLIEHFRNIMSVIITGNSDSIESAEIFRKKYMAYIDKFSQSDLLRLMNFLNKSGQELRFSQNQKLKIEIVLCHLIGLERTSTITEIIEGINKEVVELPTNLFREQEKKNYRPEISYKTPHFTASNVTTAKVKEPEENKINSSEFNFDTIVNTWQGFVDSVSQEKTLTLGHFIFDIKPVGLSGHKVNLQFNNDEDEKSFYYNIDYITKKAHNYFGKKLEFLTNKESLAETSTVKKNIEEKEITSNQEANTGDEFADLIINELGGEEIS
ncbi:MAG: DNA polymerase III, subunit gamma and tau [Ignavibacteria bacterium GWA2_35_9]|nr:MAG: DNA polymerase III, subunit gamma and tau [Ignavibacteria bacterium GWA2_35_9]OGU44174.1 MAG: DNA polymerase III, subunit gamma and tau [Ignavibacteria bacterium GWB2_36_8]OGU49285.1 MAG: DNA polymerase III, subunit gamma and tau [Ignavibacteria bacterium GWC2_36_12]